MNLQSQRLLALLDYAQESMRTRARVASNVTAHGSFLLFDHQVESFEGARIETGPIDGDGEIWLSVPYPPGPEVPPVPASPWLEPWLSVGTAVKSLPSLADEIDGAALIAIGTHRDRQRL